MPRTVTLQELTTITLGASPSAPTQSAQFWVDGAGFQDVIVIPYVAKFPGPGGPSIVVQTAPVPEEAAFVHALTIPPTAPAGGPLSGWMYNLAAGFHMGYSVGFSRWWRWIMVPNLSGTPPYSFTFRVELQVNPAPR